MEELRITLAVAQMLRIFCEDPERSWYGYDLMRETGFPSGKIYPILARLTRVGWLLRSDPGPSDQPGAPPRVSYKLAPDVVASVRSELAAIDGSIRLSRRPTAPTR